MGPRSCERVRMPAVWRTSVPSEGVGHLRVLANGRLDVCRKGVRRITRHGEQVRTSSDERARSALERGPWVGSRAVLREEPRRAIWDLGRVKEHDWNVVLIVPP